MEENNNSNNVNDELASIKENIKNMQDDLNKEYEATHVVEETPIVEEAKKEENFLDEPKKEDKKKKGKGPVAALLLVLLVALGALGYFYIYPEFFKDKKSSGTSTEVKPTEYKTEYRMSGNSLEDFDLYFLKLENQKINKIYSPLSIKYALVMLNEGADGNTKTQISSVVGDYIGKKYVNSENLSLANALFIRDTIKDSINNDYINILKSKYDAEISYDTFENVTNVNSWVKNKTLNLLDNLIESIPDETNFILVNALAIDMEWKKRIQSDKGMGWGESYPHEDFSVYVASLVSSGYHTLTFNGDYSAKSVEIGAAINNYDIIKDIGEDKIRETVGAEYKKFLEEDICNDAATRPDVNTYLDKYIEEISTGYGKYDSSTDFLLYVDSNVKAFAKDLKEYNGTTLQYVGIMPITKSFRPC